MAWFPWMSWVAASFGAFPLVAWLFSRRDTAYGWLAFAYGVSLLADIAASQLAPADRWLPMLVFLVTQASIMGAVFLTRTGDLIFAAVLVTIGLVAALWRKVEGPDVLLTTVAYLGICGIVWDRPLGLLRDALLVSFGLGWLAWMAYVVGPGMDTWLVVQGVRLAGIFLFCVALTQPQPSLRLT